MYSIKPYLTGIYSREDKCGASDEYIIYIYSCMYVTLKVTYHYAMCILSFLRWTQLK